MDKLSLAALAIATLAGSSNRCCNRGDDGDWNSNWGSGLQSSKSLGLVSGDRGDKGDKGNKEEGELEHFDIFYFGEAGLLVNCEG